MLSCPATYCNGWAGDPAVAELKQKQAETAKRSGQGKCGQKIRDKEMRVSTSDAEARRMKMPNGGFNPACNVQLATDTKSRAIVGVEVSYEGSDSSDLSAPMREPGRRSLPVNFFAFHARHAPLPCQHRFPVAWFRLQFAAPAVRLSGRFRRETVNADLRSYRGLTPLTVRGLAKAKCMALWCALAYNVLHFRAALLA